MIIDAAAGGLVMGARHSAGGIRMMQLIDGEVWATGEMEGGEYLVNCFATERCMNRLKEINDYNTGEVDDIPEDVMMKVRHYIVPAGHWIMLSAAASSIINRSATKRFLTELDAINEMDASLFHK